MSSHHFVCHTHTHRWIHTHPCGGKRKKYALLTYHDNSNCTTVKELSKTLFHSLMAKIIVENNENRKTNENVLFRAPINA